MHKGSCLCGAVGYEIDGPLGPITYCHCSRCRKSNGSAFVAASAVASGDFHVVKGAGSLHTYSNGAGFDRVFCANCGSPIYTRRDSMPETLRIRIGTLDTPVAGKVSAHIFVGSRAPWDEILDDAPQYQERP